MTAPSQSDKPGREEAERRFPGTITIPRAVLAEAYRGLKRHYEMPELRREIDALMAAPVPECGARPKLADEVWAMRKKHLDLDFLSLAEVDLLDAAAGRISQLERELVACRQNPALVSQSATTALSASGHWVFAAAEAHRPLAAKLYTTHPDTGGDHVRWMLDQIPGLSPTKACRWLGWIQAALCGAGVSTLDELKAINKAASAAFVSASGERS